MYGYSIQYFNIPGSSAVKCNSSQISGPLLELLNLVAGFKSGRNVPIFAPEFRENSRRPTFCFTTHPEFPRAEKLLSTQWIKWQRLHPVLSNLLPEGALREMLSLGLKVHIDDEFQLLGYLGQDLPGALNATPMAIGDVPDYVLQSEAAPESVALTDDDFKI